MPTKLALNPTTGKLDLIQNLSAYAKLAVSITHGAFHAKLLAGTLVPGQWYLITDYTTYRFVVGNYSVMYRGAVEPIYVQAIDTNKVSSIAYSKTYPDEVLTYTDRQAATSHTLSVSAQLNAGVPSGSFAMTVMDGTTLGLQNAPSPVKDGSSTSFSIDNGYYGVAFNDSNKGVTWEFDANGNFHLLQSYYDVIAWHGCDWNWEEGNVGEYEISISDTTIQLNGGTGDFRDYTWDMESDAGGMLFDGSNDWALYFDALNYGHIWNFNSSGDIEFSHLGKDMSFYIGLDGEESFGDVDVVVTSFSTMDVLAEMDLSPGTMYNGSTWFDIEWSDHTVESFNYNNYGITWEVSGQEIHLKGNTHDLETDLVFMEGYAFGNSTEYSVLVDSCGAGYVSISLAEPDVYSIDLNSDNISLFYQYEVYFYGYISAREHTKNQWYIGIDCRGRKVRRYALQATAWSAQSYPKNRMVTYNGKYWLSVIQTSWAAPNNMDWVEIGLAGNYYPARNRYPFAYGTTYNVNYDSSTYTDHFVWDNAKIDAARNPINCRISSGKDSGTGQEDLDFYIKMTDWSNVSCANIVSVGGCSILEFCMFADVMMYSSVASRIRRSNIKYMYDMNVIALEGCTVDSVSSSLLQSLSLTRIVSLSNCVFSSVCENDTFNFVSSVLKNFSSEGNYFGRMSSNWFGIRMLNNRFYTDGSSALCSSNVLAWIGSTDAVFSNNTINAKFTNSYFAASNMIGGNSFNNDVNNVEIAVHSMTGCTFNGELQEGLLYNVNSSIRGTIFNANTQLNGNQISTISGCFIGGALNLNSSIYIFKVSGVSSPPVVGYTYSYNYIKRFLSSSPAGAGAFTVLAVYIDGTGSGVVVLQGGKFPVGSGTLTIGSGSSDPTISYSECYDGVTIQAQTSSTPLPAIGDVYADGTNYYFYVGMRAGSTAKWFVGYPGFTGSKTLTRVTGSGASTLALTSAATTGFSAVSLSSVLIAAGGDFRPGCFGQSVFFASSLLSRIVSTARWDNGNVDSSVVLSDLSSPQEVMVGVTKTNPLATQIREVTGSSTIQDRDRTLICNSGSAIALVLPTSSILGTEFKIKNVGTSNVTLTEAGGATIDGVASVILYPGEKVTVQKFSSSAWYITGS